MAESQVEPSPGKLALVASPSADTTTVDIATADGDILLVLGETRLRVSSVILSSASPVFKTMFRPNFKEGQGDRSAQDPKEVAMVDDDLAAMTTLCRLLHHQRSLPEDLHDQGSLEPHARELLKLAVLADKYDCTGSIQMAVGYLFFDLAASSKPGEMPMAALLYLTAASFVMEDRRHFALFTRRLMMDHTSDYILVAHHPAVAILPGLFLLLLEQQRKAVWLSFPDELTSMATSKCPGYGSCAGTGTDYSIFAKLVAKIHNYRSKGPISWPAGDRCLRYILKETYGSSSGLCYSVVWSCVHGGSGRNYDVSAAELKAICDRVNKSAAGLCLTCL